jgi:hypothetical protein
VARSLAAQEQNQHCRTLAIAPFLPSLTTRIFPSIDLDSHKPSGAGERWTIIALNGVLLIAALQCRERLTALNDDVEWTLNETSCFNTYTIVTYTSSQKTSALTGTALLHV